jgi:DNA-binding CsgD family transcriptional regulator
LESIEGDCILFLDNLKALSLASLKDNEIAIQVMNALKKLSNKYKEQNRRLTIVVFAHVNKIMAWQPMELNHLSGAKELQIFLDSAIGFAESSQNPKIKYLKHLKSRNAEKHTEVLLLESTNENGNHVFRELGWDEEADHLAAKPESGTVITDTMYQAYNLAQQGISFSQIAKQLYISDKTVKSYIEKVRKTQGGSEGSESSEARNNTPSSESNSEVPSLPNSEAIAFIIGKLDRLFSGMDNEANISEINRLLIGANVTLSDFDGIAKEYFSSQGKVYHVQSNKRSVTPF